MTARGPASVPTWAGLLFFLALSAAVYAPSFSGGFLSDDTLYIEHNELFALSPAAAFVRLFDPPIFLVGNWAPVHFSFLYAENAIFGRSSQAYRMANVVLFAACAAAFRRLAERGGATPGGALLAASLLIVHPAAVEAVAWINQSKTLLALLFALIALERWLAHLAAPSAVRLAAALGFAALALLSKSAVILLPAVFAVACFSHARSARRELWALLPLGMFALYVLLRNLEAQVTQGGVVSWFGGSPAATARILPSVVWRYLRMAILPYDPVFCVQPEPIAAWADARVWLPLLGCLTALGLGLLAAFRDRRAWLAIAWVAAVLLPVIQLVPMTTVYADRYLTMALPAVLLLAVEPVARSRGWADHARVRWAAAVLLVFLFGARSAAQARLWSQPEKLFLESVTAYPSSRHAWTGLGGERFRRNDLDGGADAFLRALAIKPDDGNARYLLGRLRLQQGRSSLALSDLEQAARDVPTHHDADWMRAVAQQLRAEGVKPSEESR